MIATPCPSAAQLDALSLGQLNDQQSDELLEHLRGCASCQAELETHEDGEDSLVALLRQVGPPEQFDEEPACQRAINRALGALALAGDPSPSRDAASPTDLSDRVPDRIGEYELVRPLGRGGMGTVWLARHTKLGREVALKFLAGHRLGDPRMRQRFEAEMRAIGGLSHPNIVAALDAREVAGAAVLVTESIDGLDLGQVVERTGPLTTADACEIARQVALALAYISGQGFVHRDVKPSNIMLSRRGEVKLLDLGLARLQWDERESNAGMTAAGQALGTADYVAPEQVSDSRGVDVRADIYSLGCTLFKLLSGTAPFSVPQYTTAFAKMNAHVSAPAPSLAQRTDGLPPAVVKLVDAMLAKDPAKRPQTAEQVATELARFVTGSDLPALLQRALETSPAMAARPSATTPPPVAAHSKPLRHRTVGVPVAIAAGLLGVLIGFAMGIAITVTKPDGSKLTLTVPDGSDIDIRSTEAEAQAAEPGPAAMTPAQPADRDPVAAQQPPKQLKPPTLNERTKANQQNLIQENLKKVGRAFHNFHATHNKLPGSANQSAGLPPGATGKKIYPFSWRVALLPYLDEVELYQQYRFDEPWDSDHNLTLLAKMPKVFSSPRMLSDQDGQSIRDARPVGETHLQGFVGESTALGNGEGESFRTFTDGTSPTLLIVESHASVPWTKPQDLVFNRPEDAKTIKPLHGTALHCTS